jgi:hypothetical protein
MPVFRIRSGTPKYIRFQGLAGSLRGRRAALHAISNANPTRGMEILYGKAQIPGRHYREYPLRDERSGGPPLIAPAWRRNRRMPCFERESSRLSRMMRAIGRPVSLDLLLGHSNSSSDTRNVNCFSSPASLPGRNSLGRGQARPKRAVLPRIDRRFTIHHRDTRT